MTTHHPHPERGVLRPALAVAVTGLGAALALAASVRTDLPAWTPEAGLLMAMGGLAALVLPAILPSQIIEVHRSSSPLPRVSVPPVTSGPAPVGGDGSG